MRLPAAPRCPTPRPAPHAANKARPVAHTLSRKPCGAVGSGISAVMPPSTTTRPRKLRVKSPLKYLQGQRTWARKRQVWHGWAIACQAGTPPDAARTHESNQKSILLPQACH